MPLMREAPKILFKKTVVTKGYGFNTPQDGSVCKIKVTSDEANLLTGLNEEQEKEIIVGDVDEPVDRIIEDCIRTMKEEEVCSIEFPHPDLNPEVVIPVDISEDVKTLNDTLALSDCQDDEKDNKTESSVQENTENDIDDEQSIQPPDVSISDIESENAEITDKQEDSQNSSVAPEVIECDIKENVTATSNDSESPKLVKIEFQLLSYTREPEIWEMSVTEKWRRASYHKQRGLELYARGIYQYAFRRFGLTLKYVISLEHDVPSGHQEEGMDIKGLKLSCYLNVAACQMRHHNFESVVINSTKALNLQPNNAKALYRRGAAYLQLQEYEKAKEDLTAAQHLEPKNQAIAKQLQVLKTRVQKLNQYYASAMKKMFS